MRQRPQPAFMFSTEADLINSLDTAGTEQFGSFERKPHISLVIIKSNPAIVAMRDLYMKTGQGFLLVFSIASASSLAELAGLRDEIIRIKDDENVPIVICGNKADLEDQRTVPRTKGFSLSQRWGAPYYESSARTRSKRIFLLTRPHSGNLVAALPEDLWG